MAALAAAGLSGRWTTIERVVRLFGGFEDILESWPMACWHLWQLEAKLGVTQADPYRNRRAFTTP